MQRYAVLFLALFLFACPPPSKPESVWRPIEGVTSSTWDEAQETCGPLLQKGQMAVLAQGEPEAGADARAPYDSCMAQQGWELGADADEQTSHLMRDEVSEFLDREIQPRRTKDELNLAFGDPRCEAGGPGSEVCVWEFDYESTVAEQRYPAVLTCLLPEDRSPRPDGSCQLDAR